MVCLFIIGSLELTVPHCAVKCPTNKNKDRSWPNMAPNLGFMFWSLLSSWHFNYYTYKTNLNYLLGQQGSLGTKARKQKPGCGQCLHTSATKIVTRTDHKLDKDVYFHKFCFFTVRFFFFDQLLSRCRNVLKRNLLSKLFTIKQTIVSVYCTQNDTL